MKTSTELLSKVLQAHDQLLDNNKPKFTNLINIFRNFRNRIDTLLPFLPFFPTGDKIDQPCSTAKQSRAATTINFLSGAKAWPLKLEISNLNTQTLKMARKIKHLYSCWFAHEFLMSKRTLIARPKGNKGRAANQPFLFEPSLYRAQSRLRWTMW